MAVPKKAGQTGGQDAEVMLSVRVPRKLRVRARKYALDQPKRTSLADVVTEALEEYLKKRGA